MKRETAVLLLQGLLGLGVVAMIVSYILFWM